MTSTLRCGAIGRFWPNRTGAMQDAASELRRTPLPRTPVNKGKHHAGTLRHPGSLTSGLPTLAVYLAYDVALYTPTSPAVTWGGFAIKGARCSAKNSLASMFDCFSACLCS